MTTSHSRISKDEYYLQIASVAAQRSTCIRRSVGCVLINERGDIIATGRNGVESGAPHCNERQIIKMKDIPAYPLYPNACYGAFAQSGTQLDACDAIHAEQNALLRCGDVFSIHTCYVTHSPCVHCVKLLMGTSCIKIVFREKYAHDESSRLKWLKRNNNVQNVAQREWVHLK